MRRAVRLQAESVFLNVQTPPENKMAHKSHVMHNCSVFVGILLQE
jgi:hypothetical protein